MHILIDARTTGPRDLMRLEYALIWRQSWLHYHPHDTLTLLVSPGVSIDIPTITLPKTWGLFRHKKISHHENGPDRIVSFSELDILDRNIPTITHIFDSTALLYPRDELNILERKLREREQKRIYSHSHHIIVPHLEIGVELVEITSVKESRVSVIPYLIPEREHSPFSHLHVYGINLGYWIVEGTRGDEWNPLGLLEAYAKYIHSMNGTKRLIIAGDLGNNLGHISELIRGLNLVDYVKIIGVLRRDDHHALYEYASGWISVGRYYSAGPSLSLALSYGLPILSSDIPPISDYADMTIHPNHLYELPEKLLLFSRLHTGDEKYHESTHSIIDVYARVIAETGK